MAKLFANSGDLDQMPHSAASDLGLHCLPITCLGSTDYNKLISEPCIFYKDSGRIVQVSGLLCIFTIVVWP